MTTKQIIEQLSNIIKINFDSFNYSDIIEFFEKNRFYGDLAQYYTFRKTIIHRVVKNVFNIMPFDKEYILEKYQHELGGIKYLYYPSNGTPKRVLIFFSGYLNHHTYNRFSWYWDETELFDRENVYLFINDTTNHWYCGLQGDDTINKYSRIIETIINKYNIKYDNCYCIGASMGGVCSIAI